MTYKNVLLIDDDEDDQEIFLDAVMEVSTSITCNAISNAVEALNKLVSKILEPEVIFLDLNMPIMDGEQFLKEIKLHPELREIPVIIYSTTSVEQIILKMKSMGAHDFITKPNSFFELKSILKSLLTK